MSNITEVSKPTQWKSGRRPQKPLRSRSRVTLSAASMPWVVRFICATRHVRRIRFLSEHGKIALGAAMRFGGPLRLHKVALAWTIRSGKVIAIPEFGNVSHVKENAVALSLALTSEEIQALAAAHPPPSR